MQLKIGIATMISSRAIKGSRCTTAPDFATIMNIIIARIAASPKTAKSKAKKVRWFPAVLHRKEQYFPFSPLQKAFTVGSPHHSHR
jgi:hypothetical protein